MRVKPFWPAPFVRFLAMRSCVSFVSIQQASPLRGRPSAPAVSCGCLLGCGVMFLGGDQGMM